MPALLDDHIAREGAATAIVDYHGPVSWNMLGQRVNRWISLLRHHGLDPGDRVACVTGNSVRTFEVLLACLHAGLVVVPINCHLTAREIAYILADSAASAFIVSPEQTTTCAAALRSAEVCPMRIVLGDRAADGFAASEPWLSAADPTEPAGQTCGALMLYTSGTTGNPKGVDNRLFVVGAPFSRVAKLLDYAHVVLDVPARERTLLDGPWYHSSQLFFSLLSLLQGSRLVIRGHFDPQATLAVIDREQITAVHLVPTQLVRLLRVPPAARQAFSGASLRRVWHGGGPCPVDVKRKMIDWWGPVLLEYYGATEGGAVTLIDSRNWLRRPGSVGRAVAPSEIVIVGPDGDLLPPGQVGRVFVRRPGRTFRYHNDQDKTRSAHLRPDTFTFGELGHLDEAGFLFLTGRAQDMIVSGGVNVYPAEVEAILLDHPLVRDAAVIGVPDHEFGERVVAVVELAAAGSGLDAVLDQHCRRSLAGFKVPRVYHFVDSLPREPTGKLRKPVLRDMLGLPSGHLARVS